MSSATVQERIQMDEAAETTQPTSVETTAVAPAAEPPAAPAPKSPPGAAWWVASGFAGLALLVIGLLGGVLIGLHFHAGMAWGHDRGSHVFIQNDGPGLRDRMPDRFPTDPRRDPQQDRDQSQDGGQ